MLKMSSMLTLGRRLQILPLDGVQFILEQLPDSAAAGSSGWTYAATKAISLSNGDTIARATTAKC